MDLVKRKRFIPLRTKPKLVIITFTLFNIVSILTEAMVHCTDVKNKRRNVAPKDYHFMIPVLTTTSLSQQTNISPN